MPNDKNPYDWSLSIAKMSTNVDQIFQKYTVIIKAEVKKRNCSPVLQFSPVHLGVQLQL